MQCIRLQHQRIAQHMCVCPSTWKRYSVWECAREYWTYVLSVCVRISVCAVATSIRLGKPNKLDKTKSKPPVVLYTHSNGNNTTGNYKSGGSSSRRCFLIQWYIATAVGNETFSAYARSTRCRNNNGRDKNSEKPMTIESIFRANEILIYGPTYKATL